MNLGTDRHGDLSRTSNASVSGVLTRRCRARRVRGASVSDLQAVMLACGSAGRSFLATTAPIGLGIVPGGDERSALQSSSSPITRRGPEAEIVSKGRPQAVRTAHRIARANKFGAALLHEQRRMCDAASSACKTWDSAWRSCGAKFANHRSCGNSFRQGPFAEGPCENRPGYFQGED